MFKPTLMKCKHIGYGETIDGKPYCLICDCEEVAQENEIIDLTNRKARCWCCGKITESSYSLPFFQLKETFNPKADYDSYYCTCGGLD